MLSSKSALSASRFGVLRFGLLVASLGALAVAVGCKSETTFGCFEIDGPCSGDPGRGIEVIGFPVDRVDLRNNDGVLHVGETIPLSLVREPALPYPLDTVHSVTWGLPPGITSLRVVNGGSGVGRLTALAPDTIVDFRVVANGASLYVSSWKPSVMSAVARLIIVP